MRREEAAERKRQQFEIIRERQLEVTKQRAQKKAQDQLKIQEEARKLEELKKQQLLENMSQAEKRQALLLIEQEKQIQLKK